MSTNKSTERVRINRPALILLTVIATVVGLTPVAFLLDRPQLLLYLAVGAIIIAALYSSMLGASATNTPSFLEFLLGGLGAIFPPAQLGLLCLIVYGAIFYATRFVELVVVWFGGQIHPNADLIAFYPTIVLVSVFSIGFIALSEYNLARQLYLDETGIKTAFYDLLRQRRRRLTGYIIGALVVLGAILTLFLVLRNIGTIFYVIMQLYLMGISASLWMLRAETKPPETVDAIEGIGQLFRAADYQVERSPRTGKAGIDPLLMDIDLVARKGERNLIVDVKTASDTAGSVDSTPATGLTMAAWVLSEQWGLSLDQVEPLMILVDVKADKSLNRFSKREKMKIVRVASKDIERVLGEETSIAELKEVARRLLEVPVGVEDVAFSPSNQVRGTGQNG